MGAYTNPETFIDTQSGQHFRGAIEGVAKNVQSTFEQIYKNQLKVVKKLEDDNNLARTYMQKVGTAWNSSVLEGDAKAVEKGVVGHTSDYAGAYKQVAAVLTPLVSDSYTDANSADNADRISRIEAIRTNSLRVPAEGTANLGVWASSFKKGYDTGYKVPNGFYVPTEDEAIFGEYNEWMKSGNLAIGNGYSNSNITFEFTDTKNFSDGNIVITAKNYKGEPVSSTFNSNILSESNNQNPAGKFIIPDQQANLNSIKAGLPSIFSKVDNNNKPTKDFKLGIDYFKNKEGYGSIRQVADKTKKDQKGTVTYKESYDTWEPNMDVMSKDPELRKVTDSLVGAMENKTPDQLAMLYNNTLLPFWPAGSKKIHNINDATEVSDNLDNIQSAYAKWFLSTELGPNPSFPVTGPDGNIIKNVYDTEKPESNKADQSRNAKNAALEESMQATISSGGTVESSKYTYDKDKKSFGYWVPKMLKTSSGKVIESPVKEKEWVSRTYKQVYNDLSAK